MQSMLKRLDQLKPRGGPRRAQRFRRRESAESYLFITLLSFSASVSLTRLYLSLTGYPQLGGGELHIAHVLWGGLLLFAAALLPLIVAERWVFTTSSVLAGLGVGLFIDEVGKFITQRNDYFYPAAAPIIYTFFLLTILLYLRVRQIPHSRAETELHQALGDIQQLIEQPLKPERQVQLESYLDSLANDVSAENRAELARALLAFVRGQQRPETVTPIRRRWWVRAEIPRSMEALRSEKRLRALLIMGLMAIGLLTLKNPASMTLGDSLPAWAVDVLGQTAGRHIEATTAPFLFQVRVLLELLTGSMMVISALLLAAGRSQQGSAVGTIALLVSLTTVSLLLFYFEQFSTILTTTTQFILLSGLIYYRRQLRVN